MGFRRVDGRREYISLKDFAFILVEMEANSSVSDHEDYKSAEGGSVEAGLRAVGFDI